MPADVEQLQTIRAQALQQLVDLRSAPKPTYAIDGQQVSWESYAESLQRTVDWCDRQLAEVAPFEQHSQGFCP